MFKKNRTFVKIKGLNQEKVINKIVKSIKIYNFQRIDHSHSQFEVDYLNRKQLKKILDDSGLVAETTSHHGVLSSLKKIVTSYGIISALVLCSLFYTLQYNFILKIDVFGADKSQSKTITNFVEKNLQTRYKGKIDTKKIEILLKDNFEKVSSVSVAIIGQSLVININEAVIPDEMKEGETIYSQYDGLITDINLIQGTLAVDVGDIVKKGDVLVYPYIIDSQGQERACTPKAEIFADVWLSGNETHYDYYISTERTGNKVIKSEIYLSSLLIYSSSRELTFSQYESEETINTISKNNILPLYRKKIIYYETITKEVSIDFEEVRDEIIEKARKKSLIFLQEHEIIKEENYTIREGGGVHQVEYVTTVNRNIGG